MNECSGTALAVGPQGPRHLGTLATWQRGNAVRPRLWGAPCSGPLSDSQSDTGLGLTFSALARRGLLLLGLLLLCFSELFASNHAVYAASWCRVASGEGCHFAQFRLPRRAAFQADLCGAAGSWLLLILGFKLAYTNVACYSLLAAVRVHWLVSKALHADERVVKPHGSAGFLWGKLHKICCKSNPSS